MGKEKVGSLYLYLHKRLQEDCDEGKCISRKDAAFKILQIHIPRILLPVLFKEMEKAELITRTGRDTFLILHPNSSNIIAKTNKLYDKIGLY
jgi:hypothetical protein